jgi:hypothetical protein
MGENHAHARPVLGLSGGQFVKDHQDGHALPAVQTSATTLENFSLKMTTKQADEMQDFFCENL